ncbi:hypothetical protein [Actinophytocola sp.]|uniref:hypothetical protein n=1 Tax=Actinophytocola sp. TaxID=1872138 RepID=UPI002EDA8927
MVPEPSGGNGKKAESWRQAVRKFPATAIVIRQEQALEFQLEAEHTLERLDTNDAMIQGLLSEAQQAVKTQSQLLRHEKELLSPDSQIPGSTIGNTSQPEDGELWRIGAGEARLILDQIAEADKPIAKITFQYPILHRRTATWGTVHFEDDGRQVVVRLHNSQSEKLKRATSKLIDIVIDGQYEQANPSRLRVRRRNYKVVEFDKIRILEAGNSSEAYTGVVLDGRSLKTVAREQSSDLKIAAIFLSLSLLVAFTASPLVLDLDQRIFDQARTDGWLAWAAGNYARIGSALFVAIFLPLTHVLLYWRRVRKQPAINWNVG